MARRAFYSFHYDADNWRASQVRNMGIVEGNQTISDNDWESVKRGGDAAIEKWILGQLKGRSCTIVLVGQQTAGRKWITYEIEKSWNAKMGLVGIRIHRLKDKNGFTSMSGGNPFDFVTLGDQALSSIVKLYDPPYFTSTDSYNYIKKNLENWVEEAIAIRGKY
ncbi:MAG: TIR domain-containing protein [bacterium]|nr:TIR domain-containing protein [bacterium]